MFWQPCVLLHWSKMAASITGCVSLGQPVRGDTSCQLSLYPSLERCWSQQQFATKYAQCKSWNPYLGVQLVHVRWFNSLREASWKSCRCWAVRFELCRWFAWLYSCTYWTSVVTVPETRRIAHLYILKMWIVQIQQHSRAHENPFTFIFLSAQNSLWACWSWKSISPGGPGKAITLHSDLSYMVLSPDTEAWHQNTNRANGVDQSTLDHTLRTDWWERWQTRQPPDWTQGSDTAISDFDTAPPQV